MLLIAAPFVIGGLAVALGQDANADLRNYHWYNAYAFLNGREALDFLPSQNAYFYNPLLDVPFYLLATHVPAKIASYILGCVQGLNFVLLFMLGYASLIVTGVYRKIFICSALAALGVLSAVGIAEIGATSNDNLVSLGILLSAFLIVRSLDSLMLPGRRAFGLAMLCGIPAGMAMGLKLTVVTFCVGLCCGFLFVESTWRRRVCASLAFGLGVLLGLVITYGYWGWFLQTHFGSPLFPLFNAVFQSPLAPLNGGRDMTFIPHSLKDFLLFPFLFAKDPLRVNEIWWRDWRVPILYAFLPLALLLRYFVRHDRRVEPACVPPAVARFLLGMGGISYLVWLGLFCIYRYLLPLDMLAPLLIVCTAELAPTQPRQRHVSTAFLLLIVAVSVHSPWTDRHSGWTDRYVQASLPPLGDTSDLMILMVGNDAYAHLVSEFPPEFPFVRIQGYFIDDATAAMSAMLQARIEAHRGRFLLLIPPDQHDHAQQALDHFHFIFASGACQTVIDHLHNDKPLDLCPLIKLPR